MSPEFEIEHLDPKELKANPLNFRRHPTPQRDALSGSLAEHGWLTAPIWNKRSGHLLDGHARVELAVEKEEALIPVRVIDVPLAQEKRILRAFDRIGSMAEEDEEALSRLIDEIGDVDLERLLGEITEPESGILPEADPDAIPEVVETRAKPGDMWLLGEHRLLCGDCTVATDVERLFDGTALAHVLVTDPPYAVDYVEKARDMNSRGYVHSRGTLAAAIAGDGIEAGQEAGLWRDAFAMAYAGAVRDDAAVYIWHAQKLTLILYNLLEELGFLHHQTIIWVKNNFVIGRSDYQWKHEPCFYGWKQGNRPGFYGQKNQTTVWDIARDTNSPLHPTQKPVAIIEPAILNHSRPTEAVYDPFAGSGTTLIACEQTGRVARCMEIEPRYCDVIIARYEQATGKTARLVE